METSEIVGSPFFLFWIVDLMLNTGWKSSNFIARSSAWGKHDYRSSALGPSGMCKYAVIVVPFQCAFCSVDILYNIMWYKFFFLNQESLFFNIESRFINSAHFLSTIFKESILKPYRVTNKRAYLPQSFAFLFKIY